MLGLAISQTKFTEDEAKYITREILLQLSELHRSGYTHRDVKSSNILVNNKGEVALADFGQAIPTHKVARSFKCGTLQYRAPEMQFGFEMQNSHGLDVKEILRDNCLADGVIDKEIDWIEREIQEITQALEREAVQPIEIEQPVEAQVGITHQNINDTQFELESHSTVQGTTNKKSEMQAECREPKAQEAREALGSGLNEDLAGLPDYEPNGSGHYLETKFQTESVFVEAHNRVRVVTQINDKLRFASKLFPSAKKNKTSIHLMASSDVRAEQLQPVFKLEEEPEVNSDLPRTTSSIGVSCSDPSSFSQIRNVRRQHVDPELAHYRSNLRASKKTSPTVSKKMTATTNKEALPTDDIAKSPEPLQIPAHYNEVEGLQTPEPKSHILNSQRTPTHYYNSGKPISLERRSTQHTISLEELVSNPKRFNPQLPLYDERLDIWSAGCVLAELLLGRPLFSRIRKPQDLSRAFVQLFGRTLTTSLLSQALDSAPGTFCLEQKVTPQAPNQTSTGLLGFLSKRAPNADSDLIALLVKMLSPELTHRPTCEEALAHPCFDNFDHLQAQISLRQKLSQIKFNCHESSARQRALAKARQQKMRMMQAKQKIANSKNQRDKRPLGHNSLNLSSLNRRTVSKGKTACHDFWLVWVLNF